MANINLGMIEQIAGEIEAVAGKDISRQIMAGFENITPKTKPAAAAVFVKSAIDQMDSLLPEEQRQHIMESCGVNCIHINHIVLDRARARRNKYATEEEFLAAEILKPQAGTRLEREGNFLYQIYMPRDYSHPMRCFCGLMRALPEDVQASDTYCNCSKGFVKTFWSEVLGREVDVEVLETAISGGSECRFKITL